MSCGMLSYIPHARLHGYPRLQISSMPATESPKNLVLVRLHLALAMSYESLSKPIAM